MITHPLGLVAIGVIYLFIGVVAAQWAGGRDPLDFAHPSMIVLWPVAAFVATVGLLILLVMPRDGTEP